MKDTGEVGQSVSAVSSLVVGAAPQKKVDEKKSQSVASAEQKAAAEDKNDAPCLTDWKVFVE